MLKYLMRFIGKRKMAPLNALLAKVNALSGFYRELDDEGLSQSVFQAKEARFGVAETYALIREVAFRTLGLRAYDSQVLAALAMEKGTVVELPTGEGKTLVAAMLAVSRWLANPGDAIHICTANDYLARRDANRVAALYVRFGMSVGIVVADPDLERKQEAYGCDVVYGTPVVFAQDYLQDHLVYFPEKRMQRTLGVVVVDEADSVLLDEARQPVVLAAPLHTDAHQYALFAQLAKELEIGEESQTNADFWLDHVARTALLTNQGYESVNRWLYENSFISALDEEMLYSTGHQALLHKVTQALAAEYLLKRDQHYVVLDNSIVLVDTLTGRLAFGRKWDSGLQQALEAKEAVPLSDDSRVISTISLQNYFKQYRLFAGMTGTARQEAEEFLASYGLGVVRIEPNTVSIRVDEPDRVFRTRELKYAAIVEQVKQAHTTGRPVLVGTAHVEQSEEISRLLLEAGIAHEVLNAKQHDREAYILAAAGRRGAVTVATNMAGRGVDIQLGGHFALNMDAVVTDMGPEQWAALSESEKSAIVDREKSAVAREKEAIVALGGLLVLGAERFDSRRLDAQLRGRAARQGDPGTSAFYTSMDDALVAQFAGEKLRSMLVALDIKAGSPEEAKIVTKSLNDAQKQLEGMAQMVRKQLMEYDNVLDEQRKAFYALRQAYLQEPDVGEIADALCQAQVDAWLMECAPPKSIIEEWDLPLLKTRVAEVGLNLDIEKLKEFEEPEDVQAYLVQLLSARRQMVLAAAPENEGKLVERFLLLNSMDEAWVSHLDQLSNLRQGIHLRATAKEDPIQAYKTDAGRFFEHLLSSCRIQTIKKWLTWEPPKQTDPKV